MEAPKCRFCGKKEWRHRCATVKGSGGVLQKERAAVGSVDSWVVQEVRKDSPEVAGRTLNRRGREAYNAYQRLYMMARRAIASGKACPWPKHT